MQKKVRYFVTIGDLTKTKRSTDPLKKHEHSEQGPYKALEYLHGQAYPIAEYKRSLHPIAEYKRSVHPMAEYKRSVLNRLGSFMTNSDPTDNALTYIYGHARPREPVFET